MNDALIWIHEDALGALHPLSQGRDLTRESCFIWDESYLQAMGYGLHRLVFIYETLVELGVPIYRGDTTTTLVALARERGLERIHVAWSPNPRLQALTETLETRIEVERIFDVPFVDLPHPPKLRRFFAYWKSAKKRLLKPPPPSSVAA